MIETATWKVLERRGIRICRAGALLRAGDAEKVADAGVEALISVSVTAFVPFGETDIVCATIDCQNNAMTTTMSLCLSKLWYLFLIGIPFQIREYLP
jgi:hypothetical protein